MNDDFHFEIKQELGILSKNQKSNWTKELNIVQWSKGRPKFDVREWSPDHSKMAKGITLNDDEAKILCKLLYAYFSGQGRN